MQVVLMEMFKPERAITVSKIAKSKIQKQGILLHHRKEICKVLKESNAKNKIVFDCNCLPTHQNPPYSNNF